MYPTDFSGMASIEKRWPRKPSKPSLPAFLMLACRGWGRFSSPDPGPRALTAGAQAGAWSGPPLAAGPGRVAGPCWASASSSGAGRGQGAPSPPAGTRPRGTEGVFGRVTSVALSPVGGTSRCVTKHTHRHLQLTSPGCGDRPAVPPRALPGHRAAASPTQSRAPAECPRLVRAGAWEDAGEERRGRARLEG